VRPIGPYRLKVSRQLSVFGYSAFHPSPVQPEGVSGFDLVNQFEYLARYAARLAPQLDVGGRGRSSAVLQLGHFGAVPAGHVRQGLSGEAGVHADLPQAVGKGLTREAGAGGRRGHGLAFWLVGEDLW
jgi:hypothetical protein